ncbi:hypothetical protein HDU79_005144 [Rhizoclosmatium sp. JEL0117]|nr:hypothetical protein HDU79_005144 [Rhizoclosmatium sp. JEL0117]
MSDSESVIVLSSDEGEHRDEDELMTGESGAESEGEYEDYSGDDGGHGEMETDNDVGGGGGGGDAEEEAYDEREEEQEQEHEHEEQDDDEEEEGGVAGDYGAAAMPADDDGDEGNSDGFDEDADPDGDGDVFEDVEEVVVADEEGVRGGRDPSNASSAFFRQRSPSPEFTIATAPSISQSRPPSLPPSPAKMTPSPHPQQQQMLQMLQLPLPLPQQYPPHPTTHKDPQITRVLDSLRMPHLSTSLRSLVSQIPGFDVFLDRLDTVLTVETSDTLTNDTQQQSSSSSSDKGKSVLSSSSDTNTDLVLLRKKAEVGKMRLDLELDFEERAHVFESETRKLREQLKVVTLKQQENIILHESTSSADNSRSNAKLKESLDKSSKEIAELKAQITALESDKRNLSLVVNGKIQETDSYYREMEHLRKDLDQSRTESRSLQDLLHTSQSAESKYKLLHLSATQEVDMLKQNAEWLQQELTRKTDEYRSYRAEKAAEVIKLQQGLEEAVNAKRLYEGKSRNLEERVVVHEKRIFELMGQIQEEKERLVSQTLAFKNEMNSQTRISEHNQAQYEELSRQFMEHQQVVRDTQHALDELMLAKTAAEKKVVELEALSQERKTRLDELEKQLEAINKEAIHNVVGTDLSIIGPAAQAANALQKSGKTFTQIYLEYISLNDENIGLKSDVARLTEHLNGVLNDLNERAPIIKQVSEDKQMLEKDMEKMLQEMNRCQEEREEAVAFATNAKEQIENLSLKNKSLDQESHDLGRQVQHLLLELERLKAGPNLDLRSRSPILRNADPSQSTHSGRIISERLVLFDSITEMQAQNQQLRSSLRSVSDALAKLEQNVAAQVEAKVSHELEETVVVLHDLREQVRVANLKYDTIVRERDELKWALENGGGSGNGGESDVMRASIGSSSVFGSSRMEVSTPTPRFRASVSSRPGTPMLPGSGALGSRFVGYDAGAQLLNVQNEFEEFKQTAMADIQKLRLLNDELSKVKAELDVQVARLQSSLDNSNERNRTLLEQFEASKLECTQLHNQVESYMKQQSVNEARLQEVSNQFSETRAALESKSTELRLLRSDREALVVREAKFAAENESLTQHLTSVKEQLSRVQKMYDDTNSFSRESTAKAEEKVKGLDGQITLLRAQLSAAQDDARIRSLRYETNISDARYQIERLVSELAVYFGLHLLMFYASQNAELAEAVRLKEVSKAEERRLTQHSEDLRLRLTSAERKVDQLQGSINEALSTPESVRLREAKSEIADLKIELQTTQTALDAQKAHSEQYKAIAASSEEKLAERLAEFNATYDRFKTEMEERVAILQAEKQSLEESRITAEAKLAEVTSRLEKENHTSSLELKALQAANSELQNTVSKLENSEKLAETSIKSLNDELTVLQHRLAESREAYERVVRTEADRIKTLESVKRDLKEAREEVLQFKEQALFAEGDVEANKKLWESAKEKLEEELSSLRKTNQDLSVQNKILHNQFESLSARMVSSLDAEGESLTVGSQEDQERMELIRHLRRDKDNLAKDFEVSKQNVERLQKQVDQLQSLLDESRSKLENERKSQKSAGELEALNKELLSKIDRVNVLTESNATLRHHNNVITRKLDTLEAKLRAKEIEYSPLREQNGSLLAEIEAFKSQVRSLEAENMKLLGRANEILGKYNRVDPAEHQALKDRVVELEGKLNKCEADGKLAADKLTEITQSSEARISTLTAEINELRAAAQTAKEDAAKLKDELAEQTKSSELVPQLRSEVERLNEKVKAKVTEANRLIVTKNTKITELNEEKRVLEESKKTLEESYANLSKLSETFETEKLEWQVSNQMLERLNAELTTKLETLTGESQASDKIATKPDEQQAQLPVIQQIQQQQQQQALAVPPSPSPSSKRPREDEQVPPSTTSLVSTQQPETLADESVAKRVRVADAVEETSTKPEVPTADAVVASTATLTATPAPVKIQRAPGITPSATPAVQILPQTPLPETPKPAEVVKDKASTLNEILQKKMANLKKEGIASGSSSPAQQAVVTEPTPVVATTIASAAPVGIEVSIPPNQSAFATTSAFASVSGVLGKGNVRIRPPGEQAPVVAVTSPAVPVAVRPVRGRPVQQNTARQAIQQIQYQQNPQTPGATVRPGTLLRRPPRGGSINNSPVGGAPPIQQIGQQQQQGLGRGQGRGVRPPPQG